MTKIANSIVLFIGLPVENLLALVALAAISLGAFAIHFAGVALKKGGRGE
jgi:hypothetical protein